MSDLQGNISMSNAPNASAPSGVDSHSLEEPVSATIVIPT